MRAVRAAAIVALTIVVLASCGSRSTPEAPTVADARAELRVLIEDVTAATASRYGAADDRGHVIDGAKIISVDEADAFVAVYHAWSDVDGAFHVHLAASSDLLQWNWQMELAAQASQPTIAAAADGGYVVAWEQEPDPIHLVIARYATWEDLRDGVVARRFDVPVTMPGCGEGTPAIEAASSRRVDLTFHYHAGCERDLQATATTDWTTWQASPRHDLDSAIADRGVNGHIGDRDSINFRGHDLTLIEGQLRLDDFGSWRTFLSDDESGIAELLSFRTAAGSVAFSNPTIERVTNHGSDAIVVTLYLPSEGAKGNEAGELIYYRMIE